MFEEFNGFMTPCGKWLTEGAIPMIGSCRYRPSRAAKALASRCEKSILGENPSCSWDSCPCCDVFTIAGAMCDRDRGLSEIKGGKKRW
jgi:hypothetical protein